MKQINCWGVGVIKSRANDFSRKERLSWVIYYMLLPLHVSASSVEQTMNVKTLIRKRPSDFYLPRRLVAVVVRV